MDTNKKEGNVLLALCSRLFSMTGGFRYDDRGATVGEGFGEQLIAAFDRLERDAFEHQVQQSEIQHIKYALAAYVDELILVSAWPFRSKWMGRPLQLQFFGEHLAGEGFFKRLDELRRGAVQNTDVLEVYYVCLQLGFEGVYRMSGLEKLMALQVDLRSQIEMARGIVDPRLSLSGCHMQSALARVQRNVPFWVIGCVTCALILFIYVGFSAVIDSRASSTVKRMTKSVSLLVRELPRLKIRNDPL